MADTKDHAGALAIAVEFIEDEAQAIAFVEFDHDCLDTLSDQCHERLDRDEEIESLLEDHDKKGYQAAFSEGVNWCLSKIAGAKKPRLKAYQLMFAYGLNLSQGITGPERAKMEGVTKEAFFQGVDAERKAGGTVLRLSNQRDLEARAKMRLRNYRHIHVPS